MKNFKTSKELITIFSQNFENKMQFKENIYGNKILSLYKSWENIIGDKKIAANCELFDINNGIAVITVNHSGWSQQIFMRRKKILANFKKNYPELEVNNISVIVQTTFIHHKQKIEYQDAAEKIQAIGEFEKMYREKKSISSELDKALAALKKAVFTK